MNLLKSLRSFLCPKRQPLPITVKQTGVQAKAIHRLICFGSIDAWTITQMGTTDCHRMLNRLRRMGFLYPLDDPRSFTVHVNPDTKARYRRHYWTGIVPANWVNLPEYRGFENRKTPRGNKRKTA